MFWSDRPTFVTGATGLVGTALVARLVDSGADVICLVRDWVPRSSLLGDLQSRVTLVRGDIRDQALLERALGEYEVDTVLHLAAQTIVPIAERNPISTLDTNIRGTFTLLEACRRSPCVRQIVVASSDKAYGEQADLPYSESLPLLGRHPYDVSKACADRIAQSYAWTYRLPIGVSRCGNFYGPGDLNWSRLIPGTIRSILRNRPPVIRSDGSLVREYLHVDDGARAYMLLAEALAGRPELCGEAFNFSSERPLAAVEVVKLLLKIARSDLVPEIQNRATGEIPCQTLSAEKARLELGWRSAVDIQGGLASTLEWYRKFFLSERA